MASSFASTHFLVHSCLLFSQSHHRNIGSVQLHQSPKTLLSLSSSKVAAVATERKECSCFAQTAAVRHVVGSVITAPDIRFVVVSPILQNCLLTFITS